MRACSSLSSQATAILPDVVGRGAGNIARGGLSGSRKRKPTGPTKPVGLGDQSSPHRIQLNVSLDSIKLFTGSHDPVVGFILPERLPMPTKQPVGLMCREPLQWSQPFAIGHVGCQKQVDMVGHDNVGVKIIPAHFATAADQCRNNNRGDLRLFEESSPERCAVQDAIHGGEYFSRLGDVSICKETTRWQRTVKSKCNEEGMANLLPMRKTPCVVLHRKDSGKSERFFSGNFGYGCLKGRRGQYCPPHTGGTPKWVS